MFYIKEVLGPDFAFGVVSSFFGALCAHIARERAERRFIEKELTSIRADLRRLAASVGNLARSIAGLVADVVRTQTTVESHERRLANLEQHEREAA